MKFKDADLIGMPLRIAVGKKGLAEGMVELKRRSATEVGKMKIDEAAQRVGGGRASSARPVKRRRTTIPARERVIVALDVPDLTGRRRWSMAGGRPAFYKVGLELYVAEGGAHRAAATRGGRVFLDLKLHDIPETVARAVASAARWRPSC